MKLESPVGPMDWEENSGGITAKGRLPLVAEYFQDHFPLFPVLPGVLALEIFKRITEDFLSRKKEKNGNWRFSQMSGVRFSSYLRPGDEWECRLEPLGQEIEPVCWRANLSCRGRIAAQARFTLTL